MQFKNLRWLWKTREMGDAHRFLMKKPLGNRLLGRTRRRRKANFKMGLRETRLGSKVNRTGSAPYSMVGFSVTGVGYSGSAITVLVT